MKLLKTVFIAEIVLLLLWMIVEGIYTAALVWSLVGIVGLVLLTVFVPSGTDTIGRRAKTLFVIADVLAVSFFVMQISYVVYENEVKPQLPIPYNRLKYLGYFLVYLSIICLFLGLIILLISKTVRKR
ncbi:hypothetical protein HRH25_22365 [Flavisolibacter sp. BT320]|nr:hypothetical protein [Flavisolibacter longurius]